MQVALVNTNRIRPPIAPIGLDYVAEALHAAGHTVTLLDLCWEEDWREAIRAFFRSGDYRLVGVTLRNTDDCGFTSRHSFLGEFVEMVAAMRRATSAPIVLGGVGFSAMPELVLNRCEADCGLWGDGEFAFAALAHRMASRQASIGVPGLVWRDGQTIRRNPPRRVDPAQLPPMSRSWVDNRRYFAEGGQAGFESKRGCPAACTYCADATAKGRDARVRPPAAVADEIERLLAQGIDHFHTCDPEFNLPADHGLAVCEEFGRRGFGERMRWYAYCTPAGFSRELARAMRRTGCVGINFGADNGDDAMLQRLRRGFTAEDVRNTARWCRQAGITVMFDLLLGSPGETLASLTRTIEVMKQAEADRVGVSLGVRVYPGTEIAEQMVRGELDGGLSGGADPCDPLFFLEPQIADTVWPTLERLIAGDPRFLFFDPTKPAQNYNYNANQLLVEAIQQGYRGAYWDILRRWKEDPSGAGTQANGNGL